MEENNNTFRKNAANVFRKIKAIGNSSLKVADRAATFATKAVEEKISGGVEFVDFSLLQQNDVYTGEFFDNVNSDNTDAPDSHYIQEICNPYDIDNHQEDIEELSDSINYFNNCNNLQENLQQNNPVPLDPVLSLNYAFGPNGAEAIPRNAIKITSIITENNNISSTTTFHVLPKTKIDVLFPKIEEPRMKNSSNTTSDMFFKTTLRSLLVARPSRTLPSNSTLLITIELFSISHNKHLFL